MRAAFVVIACTILSAPSSVLAQSTPTVSIDGAEAASGANAETEDNPNELICRNRPRPVSRLPNRHGRICLTAKEWDRVTQENRDEARRMLAPGAIDQTNPNGP